MPLKNTGDKCNSSYLEEMIHSYYLMVLQDFIVDRSSAHLDGFISSHWMSSSILRVEIRPEIKKKQTNKLFFF